MLNDLKNIFPGLVLCALLSGLGVFMSQYFPSFGVATLAILLGIFAGNTVAKHRIFAAGSKFAEGKLLTYSIALLGGTLSMDSVMQIGITGLSFIVLQMIITLAVAILLGKKCGFSQDFSYLMASGNAVCGSSAIAATAPAINAGEQDKLLSITIVNLVGSILMVILPTVAALMFASETVQTSALIGGVLQSIGQVVGSGAMVNENVKDLSTIFKIIRVIFIIGVVIVLGNMKAAASDERERKPKFSLKQVPWYVGAFFAMCIIYSFNFIPSTVSAAFKNISNIFEIVALAGIGMRIDLAELIRQGPKLTAYGLSIAGVQIISALALITVIFG